jgi:hypothetical protein
MTNAGFAEARAGPVSLALIDRGMEAVWVVSALSKPPIETESRGGSEVYPRRAYLNELAPSTGRLFAHSNCDVLS